MFLNKLNIDRNKFPTNDFYPFNLEIFQKTSSIEFKSDVTFFAGENGSGKSTLLSAIARKWDIHIWCQNEYSPLVNNKYSDLLYTCLKLEKSENVPGAFFAAQSFKKYAELIDEWAKTDKSYLQYHGGESLSAKSHGQTNMQYFRNRFKIKGLYLLDEPEAALSPKSQIELLDVISESVSNGNVQFIIATHSPILLGLAGSAIYNFNNIPVCPIAYEDTEYFQIYMDILMNYEKKRKVD
jgi:predicted ATPase